jgi:hypothetical protein
MSTVQFTYIAVLRHHESVCSDGAADIGKYIRVDRTYVLHNDKYLSCTCVCARTYSTHAFHNSATYVLALSHSAMFLVSTLYTRICQLNHGYILYTFLVCSHSCRFFQPLLIAKCCAYIVDFRSRHVILN